MSNFVPGPRPPVYTSRWEHGVYFVLGGNSDVKTNGKMPTDTLLISTNLLDQSRRSR